MFVKSRWIPNRMNLDLVSFLAALHADKSRNLDDGPAAASESGTGMV